MRDADDSPGQRLPALPPGEVGRSAEAVKLGASHLLLRRTAFRQCLLEQLTGTVTIAHFLIGHRQFYLGSHLGIVGNVSGRGRGRSFARRCRRFQFEADATQVEPGGCGSRKVKRDFGCSRGSRRRRCGRAALF